MQIIHNTNTNINRGEKHMFCVKEYDLEGKFITYTFCDHNMGAINIAKKVNHKGIFTAIVTEIDYNENGRLWELVVYPKQDIGMDL